mgnify:CR=1 FL=1
MTKDLNVFDKHYGLLINGEWTNGSEGNTLTAYNPANGEALATFIDATDADVDAAVNAAKEAFKTWKNTSATERATISVILPVLFAQKKVSQTNWIAKICR